MRLSFVLCCAIFLGGCSNGSAPEGGTGGRYQLVLIDDQPLPKVVNTFGFTGTQHRAAEGDLFFASGRAVQRVQYDQQAGTSEPSPTFSDSANSAFTLNGTALILVHEYGLSEVPDTGYVDGVQLIIRQNLKNNLGQKTATKFTLKYQRQ